MYEFFLIGVHFGVKKMYSLIFSKYYWRSIYTDISNYVRNCSKCMDVEMSNTTSGSNSKDDVNCDNDIQQYTTLPTDRVIRVWKKVNFLITFICKKHF